MPGQMETSTPTTPQRKKKTKVSDGNMSTITVQLLAASCMLMLPCQCRSLSGLYG